MLRALLLIFSLLLVAPAGANEAAPSAADVRPLQVGAAAPAFTVRTAAGEAFEFQPDGLDGKQLLIFYRGGWCPYCNKHLKSLRHVVPKLREAGIEVLFLSADRPERLAATLAESELDYTLLSDAAMSAARAFGLAFVVDDETIKKYLSYGIDLEAASGYDHHQLPVPAVYLIGADGKVEYMFADADYKIRLQPDQVLAAAGL